LQRGRAVAIAVSRLSLGSGGDTLVAGTAEERGHLGLHGGLDEQPGAKTGDIFQHLDQVTLPGEQGVDFGAEPIGGRYSTGHGRGHPFVSVRGFEGTYVRRHLHRYWDTTSPPPSSRSWSETPARVACSAH